MQSDIRVKEIQATYTFQKARTPLKFGAVVVDGVDFCRVEALVENRRGELARGYGGIFLMDLWAWPNPEVPHEVKANIMKEVTERYMQLVASYDEFSHPVDIFWELERICGELIKKSVRNI